MARFPFKNCIILSKVCSDSIYIEKKPNFDEISWIFSSNNQKSYFCHAFAIFSTKNTFSIQNDNDIWLILPNSCNICPRIDIKIQNDSPMSINSMVWAQLETSYRPTQRSKLNTAGGGVGGFGQSGRLRWGWQWNYIVRFLMRINFVRKIWRGVLCPK